MRFISRTNDDQVRTALPKLAKEKNANKVCTPYQDDFGPEVQRGAEAGALPAVADPEREVGGGVGLRDLARRAARTPRHPRPAGSLVPSGG